MKKLILKWLGIGEIQEAVKKLGIKASYHEDWFIKLHQSIDARRQEINGIIETLQNLDNHEVISDLHERIFDIEQSDLHNRVFNIEQIDIPVQQMKLETRIEFLNSWATANFNNIKKENSYHIDLIKGLQLRILELESKEQKCKDKV